MEAASRGWRGWMPAALSWDRAGLQRVLACTEVKGGVGLVRAACIIRVAVYILVFSHVSFSLTLYVAWLCLPPSLIWMACLLFISACLCPSFTLSGCFHLCVFASVCVCLPLPPPLSHLQFCLCLCLHLSLSASSFNNYLLGPTVYQLLC